MKSLITLDVSPSPTVLLSRFFPDFFSWTLPPLLVTLVSSAGYGGVQENYGEGAVVLSPNPPCNSGTFFFQPLRCVNGLHDSLCLLFDPQFLEREDVSASCPPATNNPRSGSRWFKLVAFRFWSVDFPYPSLRRSPLFFSLDPYRHTYRRRFVCVI